MAYPHEVDDTGVVVKKNPEADNQAGDPEKAEAVTDRPNDVPLVTPQPALANSTFASRADGDDAEERRPVPANSTFAERAGLGNRAIAGHQAESKAPRARRPRKATKATKKA